MHPLVLSELWLLTSAQFDSRALLSVVLAGDGRFAELLRRDELRPLPIADRVTTPPILALAERVEHALAAVATPLTRRALRRVCRMRGSTLGQVLARLLAEVRVTRSPDGYQLIDRP